jgi:hypothetical protein
LEVNPSVLHRWRREFPTGPGNVFPGNGKQRRAEGRIAELERKIGQQALEIDFLKGCLRRIEERRMLVRWLALLEAGQPFVGTNRRILKLPRLLPGRWGGPFPLELPSESPQQRPGDDAQGLPSKLGKLLGGFLERTAVQLGVDLDRLHAAIIASSQQRPPECIARGLPMDYSRKSDDSHSYRVGCPWSGVVRHATGGHKTKLSDVKDTSDGGRIGVQFMSSGKSMRVQIDTTGPSVKVE